MIQTFTAIVCQVRFYVYKVVVFSIIESFTLVLIRYMAVCGWDVSPDAVHVSRMSHIVCASCSSTGRNTVFYLCLSKQYWKFFVTTFVNLGSWLLMYITFNVGPQTSHNWELNPRGTQSVSSWTCEFIILARVSSLLETLICLLFLGVGPCAFIGRSMCFYFVPEGWCMCSKCYMHISAKVWLVVELPIWSKAYTSQVKP